MSIRLKRVCEDPKWVQDGEDSADGHEVEVCHIEPIQDWEINPESSLILPNYKEGAPPPSGYYINIVHFPELHLWEHTKYTDYRYKLRVEYANKGVEWLDFSAPELSGGIFSPLNIEHSKVSIIFKNLAQLAPGTYEAVVYLEAYGVASSGTEYYVEHRVLSIRLPVVAGERDRGVYTDKKDYYLTFNKVTANLSGDTLITLFNIVPDVVSLASVPFGLGVEYGSGVDPVRTTFLLSLSSSNLSAGDYTKKLVINLEGINSQTEVNIHLKVVDTSSPPIVENFEVNPGSFRFEMLRNPSETRSGLVQITNPSDGAINLVAKPSFIDQVSFSTREFRFTTVASDTLQLGEYSGAIVLRRGSITKSIQVVLKVSEGVSSDFFGKPYYFALDGHQVRMHKSKAAASYARIGLEMDFHGFGESHTERQEYMYPYFKGQIVFTPGEEVQDFFVRCKEKPDQGYQMSLAAVTIIIKEYTAEDQLLQQYRLGPIYFAPGKTPKCFPLWTDFPVRRVYENSVIRLNADGLSKHPALNQLSKKYHVPKVLPRDKKSVYAYQFERSLLSVPHLEPVLASGYTLLPFPNVAPVVSVFFETHNLVLDWFTCPGEYQKKYEFKHLTDEAGKEKYGSLESENIVLNTGWILREEIAVVNAILKSRICFLEIEGEVIPARAITKKNEIYDTLSSRYNLEIEFNIKTDER